MKELCVYCEFSLQVNAVLRVFLELTELEESLDVKVFKDYLD